MKTRLSPSRRQRGSALITVLLFTFMLIVLASSVMRWALTERRLNSRSAYWLEARNAAEAVAEYGCYQVALAFNTRMNPTFGASGTNPVAFPSTLASAFFAGSHVDLGSISLQAGAVTKVPASGAMYYVDPADPSNQLDPMVGRYCSRRDVVVVSKVTVNPPPGGGDPVTAYIRQTVSVRGAPLFAYAIFYSGNDLEFNETPRMDIYGPVHVNGNLFVGPAGSNPQPLTFHGAVTTSGHVFHAWRGTTSTAQQDGSTMSSTTAVNFSTNGTTDGAPTNMRAGDGTWKDSSMGASNGVSGLNSLLALVDPTTTAGLARNTAFKQYAAQTWKGYLQTGAMGIQSYNPMGFNEVVGHNSTTNVDYIATQDVSDDGTNVGTGSGYGHGYGPRSLIEPPLTVPATDTYVSAKRSLEEQKFSNKAGLYLKVVVNSDGSLGSMTLYGDPNSAPTGTPAANRHPVDTGRIKLGNVPSNVFQYIPYTTTVVSGTTRVTSGLYDKHQSKGVNLVQINMRALRTALVDMAGTTTTAGNDIVALDNTTKWGSGSTNGYDRYNSGSTGWNGGIYVDVATADTTRHTAVILGNGKTASGTSMVPNSNVAGDTPVNGVNGLTIATNAPVYVLGHFNSNGSVGTSGTSNSALYPDDSASGTTITSSAESPVAIAGDAITILSTDYFGTESGTTGGLAPTTNTDTSSNAYKSYSTSAPGASGSVEVAAAFISGTIETSPTSSGTQQYSGGVHNFPRFLENWGSNTVAIRGSLVNMFKSRIATADWNQSYYSAPVRQWGFDQLFANGVFPPIIPQVLSYRRVDFTYLQNAAAYTTAVNSL